MSGESFSGRVQQLHDTWAERREVGSLGGAHDFDTQFKLLLTLHEWATEGCAEIAGVYGKQNPVSPGPPPSREAPAFSVRVDSGHVLSFVLAERPGTAGPTWRLVCTQRTAGPGTGVRVVGTGRRDGQWTRARLEATLLSLLAAHERSLGTPPGLQAGWNEIVRPGRAGRPR